MTSTERLEMTTTDRIQKEIVLRAPKSRVWRALTDSAEFGTWFRVNLEGPFKVGSTTRGQITHPGYEHVVMEVDVVRMDPQDVFAYRWHPYAIEPGVDYSKEPSTLVEFRLEEAPGGTKLTVTESGFDKIPAHRRDEAFRMNDQGWAGQIKNIQRHVEG